jgi:hypothetical protein
MTKRWWAAAVVGGSLLAASCGNPNTESRAAGNAPTSDAPVEDQGVPATIDEQWRDVATLTTEPLGGVTVEDPLPPQADADTDPVVAEQAVRYAFGHYILIDLDKNLRAVLIEDGEANVDRIAEGFEAARDVVYAARVEVKSVSFTSAITADVSFNMRWQDGLSTCFPDVIAGMSMFQNGTWRLTGRTLCVLSFGAGQDCSAPDAQLPTVPEALILVVPAELGLEQIGSGGDQPNSIPVSGSNSWQSTNGATLDISLVVLTGITELPVDDLDVILASGRFGAHDGAPVDVGLRGRLVLADGVTVLVVVRSDGVLVTARSTGIDSQTLIDLVQSLAPASFAEEPQDSVPPTTLG